jgi:hypothetical protein
MSNESGISLIKYETSILSLVFMPEWDMLAINSFTSLDMHYFKHSSYIGDCSGIDMSMLYTSSAVRCPSLVLSYSRKMN